MSDYIILKDYYESCLKEHGPGSPQALAWSNIKDVRTRYGVMYDLIGNIPKSKYKSTSILDVGCGTGGFYGYIKSLEFDYSGVDISQEMVNVCRKKFPGVSFDCQDIIKEPPINSFDYVIINGVFTVKRELDHHEMKFFVTEMLKALWPKTNKGLAFNVMNSLKCNPYRTDLFTLTYNEIASIIKEAGMEDNLVLRSDYDLRETTAYVYRN